MNTRRDALRVLAGAGALAPVLRGQPEQPNAPKNIAPADYALLGILADAILPRTDTPGATDAGVPFFIDRAVGKKPELGARLVTGLAALREAGFAEATPERRVEILQSIEAARDPFFQFVKDLTIDGYYSSKEGLVNELGYHGNTFLTEFQGCTHPEHMRDRDAN